MTRLLTPATFVLGCPANQRALVRVLRKLVRSSAPEAAEAIRFGALCYFRPCEPFGSIGGNVCMIETRPREVRLSFIHGASLPDPRRLLRGSAKAKRHVAFAPGDEPPVHAIRALVRAAAAHRPAPSR